MIPASPRPFPPPPSLPEGAAVEEARGVFGTLLALASNFFLGLFVSQSL